MRSNPGVDRISNLPCSVIEHIIGLLPLYDAVRTSALSKEWSGDINGLVKLELVYVDMELDDLKTLLSKWPMLDYLYMQSPLIKSDKKECNKEPNHRLPVLKLDEIDFGVPDDVNSVFNLFRSFPNLQTLQISCAYSLYGDRQVNYKRALDCLKHAQTIPLKHLENVTILGMPCYAVEREFVKKLLMWAIELKNLTIFAWSEGVGIEPNRSKIVKKFKKLPRSSSSAKIVFEGRWRM
ncbi:uncharacterized protein LOC127264286 isoform X2 [Andrographis paniculata]|nr:uncharacterized protein LOC127264286 isoform X2 [Andrographis paniculata]